jgi:hypothetical protein
VVYASAAVTVRRQPDRAGVQRGYTVSIPKEIAERYELEKGDQVV